MQLVGIGIGLIGVILAIYFYLKTRRFKRLSYEVRAIPLIAESVSAISGLQVTFHGQPLRNLSAAKILLTNTGTDAVRNTDMAGTDPLRIHMTSDDCCFVGGKLLYQSRRANGFQFQPVMGELQPAITFEYLAPGEHCVLTMLHTSAVADAVRPTGAIVGGRLVTLRRPKWLLRAKAWLDGLSIVSILSFIVFALVWWIYRNDAEQRRGLRWVFVTTMAGQSFIFASVFVDFLVAMAIKVPEEFHRPFSSMDL